MNRTQRMPLLLAHLTVALSSTPLLAGQSVSVPHDYTTIQAAIVAVENDLDPGRVVINSNATFRENLFITQSVYLSAGTGYRPTIEGVDPAYAAVKIGPSDDLITSVIIERIDLRLTDAAARNVFLWNASDVAPLVVKMFDVDVYGDHVVSAIETGGEGELIFELYDSMVELRGDFHSLHACVSLGTHEGNVTMFATGNLFRYTNGTGVFVNAGYNDSLSDVTLNRNRFEGFQEDFVAHAAVFVKSQSASYTKTARTRLNATNNLILGSSFGFLINGHQETVHTAFINNNTVIEPLSSGIAIAANENTSITASVMNNIVHRSDGNGMYIDAGAGFLDVTADHNLVYESRLLDYAGLTPGPASLAVDPGFQSGTYALAADSPAIDAGHNTPAGGLGLGFRDLVGDPRIQDGDVDGESRIDLGALEGPKEGIFFDGFESGSTSAWSM